VFSVYVADSIGKGCRIRFLCAGVLIFVGTSW
jgi:hypothetical protein